ncbi:MAG TPA: hypothetical protein VLJ88_09910 [Propionibacteriaceae bacterium]|nr:hypothetical protein [Propionibacteriaceae bacterium]
MTNWDDLVTTALLGTDRKPLPDGASEDEPTRVVLAEAARHRAAVRAGARLAACPEPDPPPPATHEPAPAAAQKLIGDHLAVRDWEAINQWLTAAVEQKRILAPEHWCAAAHLAARTPNVDRAVLAVALGERGVWFVGRNPEWARLAAVLRARLSEESG